MALRHGLGITGNNQGVVTSADHKLDQLGMVVKTGTGNQIRQGIFYNGDPNIVVGTTGMNYSVKPFTAVLSRGASAGAIFITNDGTVTLPTTAADSSNPRIDTIYVWQREYTLDGQDSEPVLGVIRGTPNAIPQAPLDSALPAGSLRLADFTVPAGATNTNAGVGTQRAVFTAMHGGTVVVRNATELAAFTATPGQKAYQLDTNATKTWVVDKWRPGNENVIGVYDVPWGPGDAHSGTFANSSTSGLVQISIPDPGVEFEVVIAAGFAAGITNDSQRLDFAIGYGGGSFDSPLGREVVVIPTMGDTGLRWRPVHSARTGKLSGALTWRLIARRVGPGTADGIIESTARYLQIQYVTPRT